MENRALLAFVLSLAVFILWGYFLAKVQGPPPEQTAETPQTEQKQAPLIPDSTLPLPDASFQETVPAPQLGEPDLLALQKEELNQAEMSCIYLITCGFLNYFIYKILSFVIIK